MRNEIGKKELKNRKFLSSETKYTSDIEWSKNDHFPKKRKKKEKVAVKRQLSEDRDNLSRNGVWMKK